ncbi:MAG: protein kinase [Myxococcaceae bacterium]
MRCAITFPSVEAFRAAFIARADSVFVPWPEDLPEGERLEVDVTIGEAQLHVQGVVKGPDFDESGNVGLAVVLDAASREAALQANQQLGAGQPPPAIFATTRLKIDAPFVSPPTQATPTPQHSVLIDITEAAPEKLPAGTVVDGRFRIERHLATGGMGEVYRAEHVHLKRAVALKMLRRELSTDPEMWGRFEREAQLVSQLENPHVVRVFDFGKTSDGQLFLAMEFVEGETLDKRLQAGPLAPDKAVEILTQVLDGLAEAHNLGVVHRDLKPPNIMLGQRRDGGERAKILDFGIARLSDRSNNPERAKLTQVGVVVGTPAYLAPEQALADELDHRTDIYALGCVAYELLTGTPPFAGGDLRRVISQHLTAAPAHPAVINPELAKFPALCAAVLKALAKEKENRFQNVVEFREALRRALSSGGGAEVPLSQLVPQASAPWPPTNPGMAAPPQVAAQPAEWGPPPAVAPVVPPEWAAPATEAVAPVAPVQPTEDFFAGSVAPPMGIPQSRPSSPSLEPNALEGRVPDVLMGRLVQPPTAPVDGVLVRVEILGPPSRSELANQSLTRVVDAMARAGAFFAGADEEGVTFGFAATKGTPAPRAAQAMVSARDAIAYQSAQARAAINVRSLASPVKLPASREVVAAGRVRLARARAGALWADSRLGPALGRVADLSTTEDKGVLAIGGRRARKRSSAELVGRKPLTDFFEKRFTSLQKGVGSTLLLAGPPGAGHSSLAQLFLASAKKQGAVAVGSSGLDAPLGAMAELICSAVNLEVHERHKKLAAALEPLPLVEAARRSALVVAGVLPSPQPFSPGQSAHAVRVVLRAVSVDRPIVVVCDGLHQYDRASREAFFAMASQPASRELLVGLGTAECMSAMAGKDGLGLIPELTPAETLRLLTVSLGAVPSAGLAQFVHARARGVPAQTLDLLTWLDERGLLLVDQNGSVDLAEPDCRPPARLDVEVYDVLPLPQRQALLSAAMLGERFDPAVLKDVMPAAESASLQMLQSCGLVVPDGKRMRIRCADLRKRLRWERSQEANALRLKCADVLIARGRSDPSAVEPAQLAHLLTDAGDGLRAGPLWKHTLDAAVARRDTRGAREAWVAIARAVTTAPGGDQPAQQRVRVDALARAAALAVLLEELSEARGLLDEARASAEALQPPSVEYLLVEARVLRLEGRRVKAAEMLAVAEQHAASTPLLALVLAERGEAREVEGDLDGALAALDQAVAGAGPVADFSRWHGEIDLSARLEARLATICFARRDVGRAKTLLESSLARWRRAQWPFAEARVLSTIGTVLVFMQQYMAAAQAYEQAGVTASHAGDLLFQARALIQQAKAVRKVQGNSAVVRAIGLEARKLSLALGWEQGRLDATAIVEGK